jgi:predicted nucleotidyltransferase component of viral defense system
MVTFYLDAITPACASALEFLRGQPLLRGYYLAGGTALALQIGHRISTDLDWFSPTRQLEMAERETLRDVLSASGDFAVVGEKDGQLFTRLLGADVSFIYQHHPLLEATVDFDGIPLASPAEIGLMKLAAINSRGTRRDFVDLYCLRDIAPLTRLVELAEQKYADRPDFLTIAARALAYFEDAEQQPMPHMLIRVRWSDVRRYCEKGALWLVKRQTDRHW